MTFATLDAVNLVLQGVSVAPVNSVVAPVSRTVAAVLVTLEQARLQVLSRGYTFNTDAARPMVPDLNGNILVPDDVLSIEANREFHPTLRLVDRRGFLYDPEGRTAVFTGTIKVDVVEAYPFDETPVVVRLYIAAMAARIYAERSQTEVRQDLRADENLAMDRVNQMESNVSRANVFTDSASVRSVLNRRSARYGGLR